VEINGIKDFFDMHSSGTSDEAAWLFRKNPYRLRHFLVRDRVERMRKPNARETVQRNYTSVPGWSDAPTKVIIDPSGNFQIFRTESDACEALFVS
jgi:hypothetical protein